MSSVELSVVSLSTTCWGAERSLLTLAEYAPAPVRVVAPQGELLAAAAGAGLETEVLRAPEVLRCADVGDGIGAVGLAPVLLRAAAALADEPLWARGPVVSFSQWLHLPLALAGRRRGRPVSLDLHDGPFSRGGALAQAAAAFAAGRSVACSRTALSHLRHWPRRRVKVVPRPVALPDGVGPAQRGAPEDPLRLALVGRLDPEKGLRVALEALSRLRDAGVAVELDLVGAAHRAGGAPVPDRWPGAVFHGRLPHPDALRVVARADILLSTAPGEAFGRTVAEAALLAVPSVVTGGGPAELVQAGVTGWVAPANDAESLARLLGRLAGDRAALVGAGLAARRAVARQCDPALVAGAWTRAVRP